MEVDRIHPLSKDVVNKIAAGEVIQRPANAVKELLENAIDARSTRINVILNGGGLKLIQIQDNGCGIVKDDMQIVCERFTTSKLQSFDDLKKIATFGFRGEALASITYVAHVQISSKTDNTMVGYICSYRDGKPIESSFQPLAMNRGTTIRVENLFFNIPRKDAFRSPAEEFRRCETVIANYALHFHAIGFSLQKFGDSSYAVNTRGALSVLDNIRQIYGSDLARDLLPLEYMDQKINFSVNGYISKANFACKRRIQMILFINNRLVDCAPIRTSLDTIYQRYMRKEEKPFIYLSLTMPAENIDVNVHPTKSEVHFLHQNYILEKLQEAVDKALFECDSSRHFQTKQPILVPRLNEAKEARRNSIGIKNSPNQPSSQQRHDKEVVRIDSSQDKLTTCFVRQEATKTQNQNVRTLLTSVEELRAELEARSDPDLCQKLTRLSYVGSIYLSPVPNCASVDATESEESERCDIRGSLIQVGTSLFFVNSLRLTRALLYQCALERFGSFSTFRFNEPLPLGELIMLAFKSVKAGTQGISDGCETLIDQACRTLVDQSEMLDEYFSIGIVQVYQKDEDAQCATVVLTHLPVLLDGLVPRMGQLPMLLLRLAADVDWSSERACFHDICSLLAYAYAEGRSEKDFDQVVFPAIRRMPLRVSSEYEQCLLKLTSTEELYKVFERC